MKVRAQSVKVRPVRWIPFPVEHIPDRYKQPSAAPRLATCPVCHAVFMRGHWQWRAVPPGAARLVCSACARIADGVPAARVVLGGGFETAHRKEILALVRHREAQLRAQHPMERVMSMDSDEQGTVIVTTGVHMARDIGNAVHHAYHGKLAIDYDNAETELRVSWHRD
ncbi:BCAM0308 family protein [Cupriavidus sp. WKF15]|uniref:BCAM0308 family protein n=1 Tax=Cupriavidus sp. WKF15 TaxID=3032282 RepID=UPI0023E29374|nr:BCAM0308 family protein [Cupriavidus sp. WKF15]WER44696.1 BCAM0308 family protein [Cupriavidus sp. WKF15]